MKIVTLTELKNNFSKLMDQVKKGRTSLLVYERKTPIIKVVYAGIDDTEGEQHDILAARLERAGLVRRATHKATALTELRNMRVSPKKKVDIVTTLLSDRESDR